MKQNESIKQTEAPVTRDHLKRFATVDLRQATKEQPADRNGSINFQRGLETVAHLKTTGPKWR